MDSRHTIHVRLNFLHFGSTKSFWRQPVRYPAFVEILHQRKFRRRRGHNQFPTGFVSDAVMFAELDQPAVSFATQLRLETSRLVIDAGVHDPAVPTGLMPRPPVLLFKNCDPDSGSLFEKRPSHRKPDN